MQRNVFNDRGPPEDNNNDDNNRERNHQYLRRAAVLRNNDPDDDNHHHDDEGRHPTIVPAVVSFDNNENEQEDVAATASPNNETIDTKYRRYQRLLRRIDQDLARYTRYINSTQAGTSLFVKYSQCYENLHLKRAQVVAEIDRSRSSMELYVLLQRSRRKPTPGSA